MQNAPDFKIELFNAFSQPVIFLQDGKVAYANHAAAACGVDASMELAQVVLEENGSVKLRLGDLLAPATCCDYLDGALYIADENWDGAHISTDTLLNVAQAMRTPLTDVFSVSTSLFSVLEEMEAPGISRSMARLNKSFYQLLRLMCDLTEMPAAMEGSLSVRLEKIELRAFMQELYTMAESLCQTCKHTLTLSLPDKTVHVWADRGRLTRAIYNLIANAVRHTTEPSVISSSVPLPLPSSRCTTRQSPAAGSAARRTRPRMGSICRSSAQTQASALRSPVRSPGPTAARSSSAQETTAAQPQPFPSRCAPPTRRRRSSTCREPNLTIPAASAKS